jgi:hypothetical protein
MLARPGTDGRDKRYDILKPCRKNKKNLGCARFEKVDSEIVAKV